MFSLDTKVSQLNKVGQVLTAKLKRLSIETVKDLIFYYPFRYEDYSQITPIDKLQAGLVTTISGQVELIASRRSPRKRKFLTEAVVTDKTGSVKVIWFNQPWIAKNLKPGDEVSLSGRVSGNLFDLYLNSPEYEKISFKNSLHTARIVPIYSLTDGLSQKQLRFLINSVIQLADLVEDYLPDFIVKKLSLNTLNQAVKNIHFPKNKSAIEQARKRLAFDELFLIQLWSKILRRRLNEHQSYPIKFFEERTKKFVAGLNFALTNDQRKAAWEILKDLEAKLPMNRLLEGDVGSGKTIVALIAAYNVALNGYQTVFLTPTEILASQHYATIYKLLGHYLKIGLLTRSQRIINNQTVSKKDFLIAANQGEIDIIIGTHAVIQKDVEFKDLALVVVDEQHRFGVLQRQALRKKNQKVSHFLSLTATPIPRSLALTVYGDLDLSVIKESPKDRKKIITKVVPPEKRIAAYEFIQKEINSGRQVFVVCPLIDVSDKLGARSVKAEFEKLDKQIFPHLKIGLLHGQMKSKDKEAAMADFVSGRTKILVSTSVIEVGVDVRNATVMMIEGAERFGLAQLHQFRGRVGRNNFQSYCFLFSESQEASVLERLNNLVSCHNGFDLAQKDLRYRGAGQIYGYEQSGFTDLKIATLDDLVLAKTAAAAAEDLINNYQLDNFPQLSAKLESMNFTSHLE